jgi:hypothetical protein
MEMVSNKNILQAGTHSAAGQQDTKCNIRDSCVATVSRKNIFQARTQCYRTLKCDIAPSYCYRFRDSCVPEEASLHQQVTMCL